MNIDTHQQALNVCVCVGGHLGGRRVGDLDGNTGVRSARGLQAR